MHAEKIDARDLSVRDFIHKLTDGRTWDLGYPRTVVRPGGKLVTIYYFATNQHKEQHIAATIWTAK